MSYLMICVNGLMIYKVVLCRRFCDISWFRIIIIFVGVDMV